MLFRSSKAFSDYYTQYPDDERAVHAYYYDAWSKYRLGKWRDASDTFKELADKHPNAKYASEALYRSAEAIFNLAQGGSYEEKQQVYAEAMDAYDEVPRRYPKSDYVDDSLYQKAWALINQERKEEALPLFEQIVSDHPDGRYEIGRAHV